jgi:hypothetical protein
MQKALKLLQGYIWHPRDEAIELADYLPKTLEGDVHLLWDAMPSAPFTFFDDGTLSATQQLYQFTAIKLVTQDDDGEAYIPALVKELGSYLEATPQSVGWQLLEDRREV